MINVAIIGTGNISPKHIEAYLKFPERCKIVALVDIYPEKAEAKAKEFNLTDVEIYDSHKALLDKEDLHLVSVCTPPYVHKEISVDFLNHGKNVLVEKPMAASLEECDAMIKAQKESGKLLAVIAQNRFRDSIMGLKQILDTDLIGKVLSAEVNSLWWRGRCYYDLWWRGTWEKEGGGCTLNHAVHHIDMINWMMGMPKKVSALVANVGHDNSEVEDLSVALLEYGNGAIGRITSSLVHHGEKQGLCFQGEKASINAPWEVYAYESESNGFPRENPELKNKIEDLYKSLKPLEYKEHAGEIENVLYALENGVQPLITAESGRNTIELITAIYKAGFSKSTVELPIQPDDNFYTVDGIMNNIKKFYEKTGNVENFENVKITVGSTY